MRTVGVANREAFRYFVQEMADAKPLSVVIAGGTGRLGRELAKRLQPTCAVRVLTTSPAGPEGQPPGPGQWSCDLLSIPQTEVALAGADVAVFLARVSRPPARLVQADDADLDALMADSFARAAARSSVKRIVFFAADGDLREALLRASGLPLSVLRGGGGDPVAALLELVLQGEPGERVLSPCKEPEAEVRAMRPGVLVCSVQKYVLPQAWTARDVADGYFTWLSGGLPLMRVEHLEQNVIVRSAGVPVLMLRHSPGSSERDSAVLDVFDGALVGRARGSARLEFRVMLTGGAVFTVLHGFTPSLPWPVYRVTQALAHSSSMKRFGRWLSAQGPRNAAA